MLKAVLMTLRFTILILTGHQQVVLENAALRQQLAILKRDSRRPRLRRGERLFWILLMKFWKNWKSALLIVQPATVVSWHRRRFKRYWWKLSVPTENLISAQFSPIHEGKTCCLEGETGWISIQRL